MFVAKCEWKLSEQDDFEKGVDPSTTVFFDYNYEIKEPTLRQLLKSLKDEFECEELDVDDFDDGLIFIGQLEYQTGIKANDESIEKWKMGQYELWSSTYAFRIIKETAVPTSKIKENL